MLCATAELNRVCSDLDAVFHLALSRGVEVDFLLARYLDHTPLGEVWLESGLEIDNIHPVRDRLAVLVLSAAPGGYGELQGLCLAERDELCVTTLIADDC